MLEARLHSTLMAAALEAEAAPIEPVSPMASIQVVSEGPWTRLELARGDVVLRGGEQGGVYEGEIRLANRVRYVGRVEPVAGGLRLNADSQFVVGNVGLSDAPYGERPIELEIFARQGFGYTEGRFAGDSGGRSILVDQGAGVALLVPSSSLRLEVRAGVGANAGNNGGPTPGGTVQTGLTLIW